MKYHHVLCWLTEVINPEVNLHTKYFAEITPYPSFSTPKFSFMHQNYVLLNKSTSECIFVRPIWAVWPRSVHERPRGFSTETPLKYEESVAKQHIVAVAESRNSNINANATATIKSNIAFTFGVTCRSDSRNSFNNADTNVRHTEPNFMTALRIAIPSS